MTAYRKALSDAIGWARGQAEACRRTPGADRPGSVTRQMIEHYDTLASVAEEFLRLPWNTNKQQEDSMAVDRKALAHALEFYRRGVPNGFPEFKTIFTAAEAHLASLPRTKIVYEVAATDRPSLVYDTVEAALDLAGARLKDGLTVRLSRLEIPAGQT